MNTYLVDAMLGKLARWMRILGLDTLFVPAAADRDLITRCLAEDRILVTRDRRLAIRRLIRERCILIDSSDWRIQVPEFLGKCACRPDIHPFSRCLECNSRLVRASEAAIVDRVPPYVRQRVTDFQQCPSCKRIYWPGTHRERIRRILAGWGISG